MDIKKGYLLVTDISGYTQFLVESELGHAKEILDSLLKTTMEAIEAPVRVLNTRGDAVLCFVDEDQFVQPQSLLESIERIYYDFRSQLSFMDLNTNCECNACVNINTLDLKVFLHYGEYIEQELDGATELQGADVILVNLLMKNTVKETLGLSGYALISDAAVKGLGAEDLVGDMTHHTETYEHFDEVGMRIWNLASGWKRQLNKERAEISSESAWISEERLIPAPQLLVWDYATDKDMKRVYLSMEAVHRTDDLGGPTQEGSEFHCVHSDFDIFYSIADWNPPHHFVASEVLAGFPIRFTMQFIPADDGTLVRMMYADPRNEEAEELKPVLIEGAQDAMEKLAGMLEAALVKSDA